MKASFNGKIIWITGASSGIGESLAYAFAKYKVRLILSSRRKEELERVASRCMELGSDCYVYPFDLSIPTQCETAADEILKKFTYIDILVNNGGVTQRSLLADTIVEVDRRIMEIDYFSGVILTKKILPSMIQRKSGHIVAVSSVTGVFGFPLRSSYSAAKHAMVGFYETLWAELHEQGVDVTIACPGRIRTNVSINALTQNGDPYGIMDHGQDEGISADKCAQKIIRAISRKKVLVYIAGKELVLIYLKRYIPYFFYKLVGKVEPT
jgi:dehydrogenase/reductase SDR family member 7B